MQCSGARFSRQLRNTCNICQAESTGKTGYFQSSTYINSAQSMLPISVVPKLFVCDPKFEITLQMRPKYYKYVPQKIIVDVHITLAVKGRG